MPRVIALLVACVLAGAGMVAYGWDTLTALLAGQWHPARLGIAAVALVLFVVLLRRVARVIATLDAHLSQITTSPTLSCEERPL